MRSFTITEEPFQPVMFSRLSQEIKVMTFGDNPDLAIAYIEGDTKTLVRDTASVIRGIADLLTIQQIPYFIYTNEEVEKIEDLFDYLIPVPQGGS